MSNLWIWYFLVTVVPCLYWVVLADAQRLPQGRRQAGDRHLKFQVSRGNLGVHSNGAVDLW